MNTTLFDQATVRYKNKDYRGALRTYTACLQDTSVPFSLGEVGLIYHRIGNCLVKLKSYNEAIQAYAQAIGDPAYDAKGSLQNNIGMAYASLRDYQKAAEHFQMAIDDPDYETPYKAYMGLGNAELKLGKSAEAGVAFREAALDEENPDPAKALLNLGICFMALDRPEDAILSYESAFQFDMSDDTKNRLNASMGQAYVANEQMAEAVEAFEKATADATYVLSDSASVDYQRAMSTLARESAAADDLGEDADGEGVGEDEQDPFFYDEGFEEIEQIPGFVDAYKGDDDRFFETTDAELEMLSKNLAKKDRKHRNVGLKILVVIIILIIALLGAGVFAYIQGIGFPSQQTVVENLFEDPDTATGEFAAGLSEDTVKTMIAPVVHDANVTINGVEAGASESVVYATAKSPKGGDIYYKISLVRDLISWKISGIELYFPSQNQ